MLNTLIHGDCLEVMKDIPDKSIDMILCDLPYGVVACEWDSIIPFEPLWIEYKRVVKDKGSVVLFAGQPFTSLLISSNLPMFKYCWYWKKPHTGQLNAKKMPLKNVEEICVFQKSLAYKPQWGTGSEYTVTRKDYRGSECYGKQTEHTTISDGRRYPMQILEFKHDKDRLHPTQKPVSLCQYLIKTYTNEGETVLDNCMGSGSSIVAAIRTNRNYIGIEKELKYFETAKIRCERAKDEAISGQ